MKKDEKLGEIDLSKFGNFPMKPYKPGQIGEVKIGGFTVEVFSKSKKVMGGAMGRFCRRSRGLEIWLQTGLSGRLREWIMLHELIHLVIFLTIGSMEEEDLRGFSTILFEVLKDNFKINFNRLKNGR